MKILILDKKVMINKDNEIIEYKITNIYKELEDIVYEYDIKKTIIILNDINHISKIVEILGSCGVDIKKIYNLYEIIFNKYNEIIIKENEEYFYISNKEKINIDYQDDFKYFDIEVLCIDILKDEKINAKNLIDKIVNVKYLIILLLSILFIAYILLSYLYKIENLVNIKILKSNELELKIREYQVEEINYKKMSEKKKESFFYENIEKYKYEKILDKIINSSNEYFYFDQIYIHNGTINLKGVCKNLDKLNKYFIKYDVNKLLKSKEYIFFDIDLKNKGD